MFSFITDTYKRVVGHVKASLKKWLKPTTTSLTIDAFADATRSRRQLIVENARDHYKMRARAFYKRFTGVAKAIIMMRWLPKRYLPPHLSLATKCGFAS